MFSMTVESHLHVSVKNLLAVNKVKTIEKLLHNLLDLSQAELDIHVGEEARQVVLAEVEHQVECGLVQQISITLTMFSEGING